MSGSFSSSARVRLVLPPPDGAAITNRVPTGVIGAVIAALVAMRVLDWITSSALHFRIPVSHCRTRFTGDPRLPTGPCRPVLGGGLRTFFIHPAPRVGRGLLDVLHLFAHLFDEHFYFQRSLRQFRIDRLG